MKYFYMLPDDRKQSIRDFCESHHIGINSFIFLLLSTIDLDEVSKLLEKE